MDTVDLPLLPAGATLAEAGEAMHAAGKLAVVTRRHGELVVLTTEDMHRAVVHHGKRARHDPSLSLRDVSPGHHKHAAHPHETPRRHATEAHGHAAAHAKAGAAHVSPPHTHTLSAMVREGDATGRAFSDEPETTVRILEHDDGMARVATRHEGIAASMAGSTNRGTCRDPAHDRWFSYELIVAGICNFDDSRVDF